jgi:hypothetical protein
MDILTAARPQMDLSLAFHMIFAAAGMALPLMMLIAEARWLRTGDRLALGQGHRGALRHRRGLGHRPIV